MARRMVFINWNYVHQLTLAASAEIVAPPRRGRDALGTAGKMPALHVRYLSQFCERRQLYKFVFHQFDHDRFLRVKPVLGLLEDH